MTDFFYLLDVFLMQFSYENRKKKFLITFTSPCFTHIKVSNFTSGWGQNRASRKTGDSRAVTSIQERPSGDFFIPQLFYMCKGRKLLWTKMSMRLLNTQNETTKE